LQVPAAAIGSVSGSGMVTAGGYAASRSATDLTDFSIKPTNVPEAFVSGTFLQSGTKKPFFPSIAY
jgi:hypothetical protein